MDTRRLAYPRHALRDRSASVLAVQLDMMTARGGRDDKQK